MKIRKGFETNSSSSHSLVISAIEQKFLLEMPRQDDDGIVWLYGGEYGWEVEEFNDFDNKAGYLMLYAIEYYPNDRNSEGLTFWEVLCEVIKLQTGCKEVKYGKAYPKQSYSQMGYIDHQSIDSKDYHSLFDNKEALRNFLFNKRSFLITDNDNRPIFPMEKRLPKGIVYLD